MAENELEGLQSLYNAHEAAVEIQWYWNSQDIIFWMNISSIGSEPSKLDFSFICYERPKTFITGIQVI